MTVAIVGGVLLLLVVGGAGAMWAFGGRSAPPGPSGLAGGGPSGGPPSNFSNNGALFLPDNNVVASNSGSPPTSSPSFPGRPGMPGPSFPAPGMPGPSFSGPGFPGPGAPSGLTPTSPGSSTTPPATPSWSGGLAENPAAIPTTPSTPAPTLPTTPTAAPGDVPNLPSTEPVSTTNPPAEDATPESPLAMQWQAEADPMPQPVEYKKGKIEITLPSQVEIILPVSTSHFVMAGASEGLKELRQVFDLRTGKAIGQPIAQRVEKIGDTEVLSPDGRYMALVQEQRSESIRVGVYSFATGAIAREFKLEGADVTGPLRFGASHHLVILYRTKDREQQVLAHYNIQTGEKVSEVKFDDNFRSEMRIMPESLTISPGGRFAAVLMGEAIGVIDLTSGKPAGALQLSKKPSRSDGMSFSPDGTKLAAMISTTGSHQLYVFDFQSGKTLLDHDYGERLSSFSYKGPELDWVPDGSGLVYQGHLLLEPTTGGEVWEFPHTDNSPRRMVRPGEILVLLRNRGTKVLGTADLPEKDIAAAVRSIREGGNAIDSILPPLSTPDLFAARQMTLPDGFVQWTPTVDPGDRPLTGADRDVLIAAPGETLRRAIFASPSSKKVVIQKEITPRGSVGRRAERKAVIERYDVATGSKGNTLDVPTVYQLADVSPSGNLALLAFAQKSRDYDRLDVLQISPKKHLTGWRPYANEVKDESKPYTPPSRLHRGRWFSADAVKTVAWSKFIDDEHLLTVNPAGKLICWKLPECKALYVFADFGEPLAISPAGKYFAGAHHGQFRVFESHTGNCVGDLEAPAIGTEPLRAAFRADGKELTSVVSGGADTMLVRWDLETGKRTHEFPVPSLALASGAFQFDFSTYQQAASLEYRGDNHLMIDGVYMVDLNKRAVTWQYQLVGGMLAQRSPSVGNWFISSKSGINYNEPLFLAKQDAPSAAVESRTAAVSIERQLVVYPGMSVRVMVDLNATGMSQYQKDVERNIVEGLTQRGLRVDPNAEMLFTFVTGQRSTGTTIGFYKNTNPYGFGFPGSMFNEPRGEMTGSTEQMQMMYRIAFSDRSGRVLWHLDQASTMRESGKITADNAAATLQAEMVNHFDAMIRGSGGAMRSVPRYVFRDFHECVAGQSRLKLGGEIIEPVMKPAPPQGQPAAPNPTIQPGT